jgi:hypothetical protein
MMMMMEYVPNRQISTHTEGSGHRLTHTRSLGVGRLNIFELWAGLIGFDIVRTRMRLFINLVV